MFTPQSKATTRAGISFTPSRGGGGGGGGGVSNPRAATDKGKSVMFADEQLPPPPPPPPLGLFGSGKVVDDGTENMEDWRKFREEGLLDEAALQRRDMEAMDQKIEKLQGELHDYQHTMGLLLIEKEDLASKYNELRQDLEETQAILKREQSAHLIALADTEKREENLKQALSVERQCVADLEKALRDTRNEGSQIKHTSDKKLAEASALVVGIDEKSLEVQEKLHAAEAKLAEANRKSSEMDLKLQELETRESVIRREQLSLTAEQEAHKEAFYKERENLREWERKLQEGEKRLSETQRTLIHREEEVTNKVSILSHKEKTLEEMQKNVDLSNSILKKRDDELNGRLAELSAKEKGVVAIRSILDTKEKELLALEEKLSARERVEIQKVLDDHRAILDKEKGVFELEMEEKRRDLEKELKSKVEEVEQRELEISHKEDKLKKREQALEKKSDRVREKEKDNEVKLKSIKEQEKMLKAETKKVDAERQELLADKRSLEILKEEMEKRREEVDQLALHIKEEEEKLRLTEKERTEHLQLQSELKRELEKCRHQREFLSKEAEDLKQERDKFEKEWEILDEKKAEINKARREIAEGKQKFEKFQNSEEERLEKEKQAIEECKASELEALRLEKESFTAHKKHEEALLDEKRDEHSQMVKDLELQRKDIDLDMQKRLEELEKHMRERERELEEEKHKELRNISDMKETVRKDMAEVESEKWKIEQEKEALILSKDQLKKDRLDLRKDIDELVNLSKKLKHQREQLMKERRRFLNLVDKHNSCKECGDITRNFVITDLPEMEDEEPPSLPRLSDEFLENSPDKSGIGVSLGRNSDSGGRMSWVRKYTSKIFKLSPSKTVEPAVAPIPDSSPLSGERINLEGAEGPSTTVNKTSARIENEMNQDEQQPSSRTENDSVDLRQAKDADVDAKAQDIPEESQQSKLRSGRRRPGRKSKSALHRTRSVKAVVEDAKSFLGESDLNDNLQATDISNANEESQVDSGNTGKAGRKVARKRQRASRVTESKQDGNDSDGGSDSVTTGKRRKRRQTIGPTSQTPRERRYNLRHHRPARNVTGAPATSDTTKTEKKEADGSAVKVATTEENTLPSSEAAGQNGNNRPLVEVTTVRPVELQQERVVRFERMVDANENPNAMKPVETIESSEEANGTPEYGDDGGAEGEDGSDVNEDCEDLDDDSEQPGEASIGKKIWTFFTT